MDKYKHKIYDEMIEHLGNIQGGRLKELIDQHKHSHVPKEQRPEDQGPMDGERHIGKDALKGQGVDISHDPGDKEIEMVMHKEEKKESPESSDKDEDMSDEEYEYLTRMYK